MEETGFFRTVFRGFHKQDVFAYLEQTEQKHQQELDDARQQVEQATAELQQLRQEAQTQTQAAQQAAGQLEQVQAQLAQTRAQVERLRTERDQAMRELAATRTRAAEAADRADAANRRAEQLTGTNAALTAVIGDKAAFVHRVDAVGQEYLQHSLDLSRSSLEQIGQMQEQLSRLADEWSAQTQENAEQMKQLRKWLRDQTGDLDSCLPQQTSKASEEASGKEPFFR